MTPTHARLRPARLKRKKVRAPAPPAAPLTHDQRALVEAFAAAYPRPIALLRAAFPGMWYTARAAGLSVDEITSACWVGVVRAAQLYRPDSGIAFSTYVGHWVRGKVGDAARKAIAQARRPVVHPDRLEYDGDPHWDSLASVPPEPPAADGEELWALVRKWLDPRWLDLVRMRVVDGLTLRETGDALGISKERVRQIESRALARLREKCRELEALIRP